MRDANAKRLMLPGYDPVAHFTQNTAVLGNPARQSDLQGVTWRFASADNHAAFLREPTKYRLPCGGCCANGINHAVPWAPAANRAPGAFTATSFMCSADNRSATISSWRPNKKPPTRPPDLAPRNSWFQRCVCALQAPGIARAARQNRCRTASQMDGEAGGRYAGDDAQAAAGGAGCALRQVEIAVDRKWALAISCACRLKQN